MKGWDPSHQTEVQKLNAWPGLVRTSRLTRTALNSMEEVGRHYNQKASHPKGDILCKNKPPKAQSFSNKHGCRTPLSLEFQGMTGHMCLEKTLHNNTKKYIF